MKADMKPTTDIPTPPVLPWHAKAAVAILNEYDVPMHVQPKPAAAIIARHDPAPLSLVEKKVAHLQSQHAETLRLLADILAVIEDRTTGHTVVYSDRLRPFISRIRAHLSMQSQPSVQSEGGAQ